MRCFCCDSPLSMSDINVKKFDGSEGDLCYECRYVIDRIDEPSEKEYKFQDLTEGYQFVTYIK